MVQQTIDTTTNNGSYTGDPAKTAFGKVNANFTEVYNNIASLVAANNAARSVATGGTGATSAAAARANLGAAASGVNSDITALNQASVQFGSGSQNPVASRLGGATMNYGSGLVINTTTNASTLTLGKVSTAGAFIDMYFTASSVSSVGSIATNGSQTYYNTTSDYRLKKDYRPIDSPWDRVLALKPINHGWRADADLRTEGFIAHELQAVLPGAVVGEKNAVTEVGTLYDADGNVIIPETQEITDLDPGWRWEKTADRPIYQQVDLAKLVPLLTAALQEAQQRIVALEQKIGAA